MKTKRLICRSLILVCVCVFSSVVLVYGKGSPETVVANLYRAAKIKKIAKMSRAS